MPTYDYQCTNCDHEQESMHSINDKPLVECEKCGAECSQILSLGSDSFIFRGEGWASKKIKIHNQMKQKQKVASSKQDVNWGHLKGSTATPNFNGEITGEAGDPEAWRKAGNLAKEAGKDSKPFEDKAVEVEKQKKLPSESKQISTLNG